MSPLFTHQTQYVPVTLLSSLTKSERNWEEIVYFYSILQSVKNGYFIQLLDQSLHNYGRIAVNECIYE